MNKNIPLIFLALVAMVAGIWLGASNPQQPAANLPAKIRGAILPQAKTITPFNLTDHNKQAFTLEQLKNHWSIIFVGYTQCPDVCPAALSVLKQVDRLITEQAGTPPTVIFISVDPERDSYALLAKYVTYFNKTFIGITGEQDQLRNLTRQLSVSFAKAPGSSGKIDENYLMDHSSSFMLINPDGKLQAFLTAPHIASQIVDDIKHSQDFYNTNK